MVHLALFTGDMDQARILLPANERSERDPDAYAVVEASGPALFFCLHVDDPKRGRELAAAIIAACDDTEAERARHAVAAPEAQASTETTLPREPEVGAPTGVISAEDF